jgi:hypothetical protein
MIAELLGAGIPATYAGGYLLSARSIYARRFFRSERTCGCKHGFPGVKCDKPAYVQFVEHCPSCGRDVTGWACDESHLPNVCHDCKGSFAMLSQAVKVHPDPGQVLGQSLLGALWWPVRGPARLAHWIITSGVPAPPMKPLSGEALAKLEREAGL